MQCASVASAGVTLVMAENDAGIEYALKEILHII